MTIPIELKLTATADGPSDTVTPGPACGRDFATWVRLCFTAVPPADLDRALERLAPLLRP